MSFGGGSADSDFEYDSTAGSNMNTQKKSRSFVPLLIVSALLAGLAACGDKGKKELNDAAGSAPPAAQEPVTPPADATAATAPPRELTPEQQELEEKKAKLEYGTMEDKYLGDPRAQWASSASASSSYAEKDKAANSSLYDSYKADKAAGKLDGGYWSTESTTVGMDWLQLGYDKPVSATEVRVVFPGGYGVEAVHKIELIDANGALNTVWSGISDVKRDERGERTWFVKQFPATPYKVKGVKITIANNLSNGEKHIDAVQLVGD